MPICSIEDFKHQSQKRPPTPFHLWLPRAILVHNGVVDPSPKCKPLVEQISKKTGLALGDSASSSSKTKGVMRWSSSYVGSPLLLSFLSLSLGWSDSPLTQLPCVSASPTKLSFSKHHSIYGYWPDIVSVVSIFLGVCIYRSTISLSCTGPIIRAPTKCWHTQVTSRSTIHTYKIRIHARAGHLRTGGWWSFLTHGNVHE